MLCDLASIPAGAAAVLGLFLAAKPEEVSDAHTRWYAIGVVFFCAIVVRSVWLVASRGRPDRFGRDDLKPMGVKPKDEKSTWDELHPSSDLQGESEWLVRRIEQLRMQLGWDEGSGWWFSEGSHRRALIGLQVMLGAETIFLAIITLLAWEATS